MNRQVRDPQLTARPTPPQPVRQPLLRRLNDRGFRLLQLADLLVLLAVLVGANATLFYIVQGDSPTYAWRYYLAAFCLAALIHLTVYYFGGLYEREQRLGSKPQLPRIAGLTLLAGGIDLALTVTYRAYTDRYLMPNVVLAALAVLGSLALAANRRAARRLRRRLQGPPRVLLVGAPDEVNLARAHVAEDVQHLVVAGHVTSPHNLAEATRRSDATDVLLLAPRYLDDLSMQELRALERAGVGVLQRVTARDTLLGLEGVRQIGGMPFVALRTHTLPVSRARLKRSIEVLALLVTAPVTLPLLALAALYVRAVAGAPVLFWQLRVGQEGRLFDMVKFRTMYANAEADVGAVLAQRADPRVIPACRWLRATRLDELPQLYNVARGQMSIVGPRPERPEMTAQYSELIPGYARRHEIPPGLTGLAQIHGRYHTDPEYKLGHDLQYLVNWSPVLDVQILLRTVWVVVTRRL